MQYALELKAEFESNLIHICTDLVHANDTLSKAVSYLLFSGGRRIRPVLLYGIAKINDSYDSELCNAAAIAVEMIHTYSLLHDDLPDMDDDNYRRNKLTCHKVYGSAMAILAGDALQAMAYDILSQTAITKHFDNHIKLRVALRMIAELSSASGLKGMVMGQALDIQNQASDLSKKLKTGALIKASIMLGILAGNLYEETNIRNTLIKFANALGMAYQLRDDINDLDNSDECKTKCAETLKNYKNRINKLLQVLDKRFSINIAEIVDYILA